MFQLGDIKLLEYNRKVFIKYPMKIILDKRRDICIWKSQVKKD